MKKKIEAMLKEAKEKLEHYNTNKDEIYLRAKINVLTELLSNAEGEVTNQQAPSELDRYEQYKNNPYYPFESEKQWLEYDNQLIDKVRAKDKVPSAIKGNIGNNLIEYLNSEKFDGQAPSATVKVDPLKIAIDETNEMISREIQNPSATVDEPKHLSEEQRQAIFNVFHINGVLLMDDELNAIESIVYPRTYPHTLKDEQQKKRYTREEVIDVGVKIVGGERFRPFVIATLDQFDKEGK